MPRYTIRELEDEFQLSRHYKLEIKQLERLKAIQLRLGLSSGAMSELVDTIIEDSDIVPREYADHEHIDLR